MAQLISNQFTSFELDQHEARLAYSYSDLQIQGLRNELATVAEMLINLVPSPENPMLFQLEYRYLQGKMDILQGIINTSDSIQKSAEDVMYNDMQQELQFPKGA